MTAPPTWRDLAARAKRLGVTLEYGAHEAALHRETNSGRVELDRFRSWRGVRPAAIVLRTAVAAALEQMEDGR